MSVTKKGSRVTPQYRGNQMAVPYNSLMLNLIRNRQAAFKGLTNLTRALAEDKTNMEYFAQRDKVRKFGAINTVPTNAVPSGHGVPSDKYPGFTATDVNPLYATRLINRRTHPRELEFDTAQHYYGPDAPPGHYDMMNDRDLPEIEALRNDALKRGSIKSQKAAAEMLNKAYNTAVSANKEGAYFDVNPFKQSPFRGTREGLLSGSGITQRSAHRPPTKRRRVMAHDPKDWLHDDDDFSEYTSDEESYLPVDNPNVG